MTEVNQQEYVDLVVAHRTAGRIAEQFGAFMEELGEVLPLDLLRVFDEHEHEILVGGMTETDMDDWTRLTDYRGYEKTDRLIEWFSTCLRLWPAGRGGYLARARQCLQGSPGQQRSRRFTIEKSGDPNYLPRSYTCYNRLDLPPYEDCESLERKLRFAIERVSFRFFPVGRACSQRFACLCRETEGFEQE